MKTDRKSQNQRILNYLLKGGSLTPLKALRLFDCWALSSRISDLNKLGKYVINSELITVKGGKRVSKYSISI